MSKSIKQAFTYLSGFTFLSPVGAFPTVLGPWPSSCLYLLLFIPLVASPPLAFPCKVKEGIMGQDHGCYFSILECKTKGRLKTLRL